MRKGVGMDRMIDVLQFAEQAKQLAGGNVIGGHMTYAFGAGATCILALGLALFLHVGAKALLETRKPEPDHVQGSGNAHEKGGEESTAVPAQAMPSRVTSPRTSSIPHIPAATAKPRVPSASDTVKRYYTMQLEELTKYGLSHTEQRIAALILHGETNKMIAGKMHLAESTIKKHVQRILSKTGTTNRKELNHVIKKTVEHRSLQE